MGGKNYDIEELRKLLEGKLPDDEAKALQQKIESDKEFATEMQLNKDLLESMDVHYANELKRKLQLSDAEEDYDTLKKPLHIPRRLAIAASLLFVLVASYFLLFYGESSSQIFNEYYKPYYNVLSDAERSGEGQGSIAAMQAYDSESYKSAIPKFDQALKEDPKNKYLQFYQAINFISADRPSQAIENLELLSNDVDFELHEASAWYLAMAYLKNDQKGRAVHTFKQIKTSSSSYLERATEVLKRLKE